MGCHSSITCWGDWIICCSLDYSENENVDNQFLTFPSNLASRRCSKHNYCRRECLSAWTHEYAQVGQKERRKQLTSELGQVVFSIMSSVCSLTWMLLGSKTKTPSLSVNSLPGFTVVTPSPMLSTMPAASWPRIIGRGETMLPLTAWSSERQIPVATI